MLFNFSIAVAILERSLSNVESHVPCFCTNDVMVLFNSDSLECLVLYISKSFCIVISSSTSLMLFSNVVILVYITSTSSNCALFHNLCFCSNPTICCSIRLFDSLIAEILKFSCLIESFLSLIRSLRTDAFSDKIVMPNNSSITSRWSETFMFRNGSVCVFSATICLNIS